MPLIGLWLDASGGGGAAQTGRFHPTGSRGGGQRGMDLGQIGTSNARSDRRDIEGGIKLGGGGAKLPVGTGAIRGGVTLPTLPSIPQIRQPIRTGDIKIPPQIIGGTKAPNKIIIPTVKPPLPTLNPRILNPPVITAPKTKGVLDVLIDLIKPKEVQPVALDLGSLLNTGIAAYRDIRVANTQPVYDMQGFNPFSNVPLNQTDMAAPLASVTSGGSCLAPGYKYDKCGNVVKTRRKRRRRLATASDIKDLASLSAVTTPAEKKTWIATHPS